MIDPRQIGPEHKQAVLARQGLRCFIDNHPVESETELEFDHIHPYSEGGPSIADNIAAVCKKHHREKGTLSLSEYRDRLALRRFFEGARKRRLDDLLEVRLGRSGYGHPLQLEIKPNEVVMYLDSGPQTLPLFECPATREKYFFVSLPVSVVQNDTDLQPRPLEPDRLWELYRHLLGHTQLAPAVCRLVKGNVPLFDGQHKAAAQVWAGRSKIDCKVYVEPELRRLKETNLSAHDKLRQMPFYTSTLLEKYAGLATEDWAEFVVLPGSKTEVTFVEFLRAKSGLSRAAAVKRIQSMIYRDVLEHDGNQFRDFITEENRGRQNPLTMYRVEKTFFTEFIAPPPLNDEFETEGYHRDEERENVVRLLNLVAARSLVDRWAPERNDAEHKKASRLYSAGALRGWVPYLADAIAPALSIFEREQRKKLFYRPISDAQFGSIERLVDRLFSHKIWVDPDPELNDLRYDSPDRAKEILSRQGLTPGWILGQST